MSHSVDYTVVAYHTLGAYENDAKVLKLSLDALKIPHRIKAVMDLGSWQANTQFKPLFIRDMLAEIKGAILYIDVDAFVLKKPVFMSPAPSVAAVTFPGGELLSGTVFFGGDDESWEIVQRWIRLCEKYPEKLPNGRPAWDQRLLKMAVSDVSAKNAVLSLPQEYCFIIGLTQERFPSVRDPYIVHTRGRLRHCPESV